MSGGGIGNLGALRPTASSVPSAYGMTLRDYFAAKAMQGALTISASWGPCEFNRDIDVDQLSVFAYRAANAMLKAREA